MMRQFFFFFVNGGMLGLLAWALQIQIFGFLGSTSQLAYAVATALTYVPMIIINCGIQRNLIFKAKRSGIHSQFFRFLVSNLIIMAMVTMLAPLFRMLVDVTVGPPCGEWAGFAMASLISSIPSFLLNKYWVFRGE